MTESGTNVVNPSHNDESESSPSILWEGKEPREELNGFDLRSLRDIRQAGDDLIDELLEVDEKYPEAEKAQHDANGDVEVFLSETGLTRDTRHERLARERIRWLNHAMAAWVEFVLDSGIASDSRIDSVLERIDVSPRGDSSD